MLSHRLQPREAIDRRSPLCCCALGVLVAAGCGDSDDDGGEAAPPPAKAEDFPDPAGKTLAELREGSGPGPVLSPSVSLLEPGKNRLGFGLFDRARKQIVDAPAALYVAPLERRAGARARSRRATSRSRSSPSSRARA